MPKRRGGEVPDEYVIEDGEEGCSGDGREGGEQHSREERGQEAIRSLPVPAFHLAIHTATMATAPHTPSRVTCGSFQ